jgi:hypothetical protein
MKSGQSSKERGKITMNELFITNNRPKDWTNNTDFISDGQSAHSLTRRPPFAAGNFLVFVRVDPSATERLQLLGQLKSPMTSEIEPATFRLVS